MEERNNTYRGGVAGMICGIDHGTAKNDPGRRTVICFKGCNFRCPWCASPETRSFEPELMLYPELEKYPEKAVASCIRGAVKLSGENSETNRDSCLSCEDISCAEHSPDGSREKTGYRITVEQAVTEVLEHRKFHNNHGVTLSGGEVTCQWLFFIELLKGMKAAGLNTAVETNGFFDMLPDALDWIDLPIIDLKHPDPGRHRSLTGFSNETVLVNISRISEKGHPLRVRIPLIPGINDGAFLELFAEVLEGVRKNIELEIIGYNKTGVAKWAALGIDYTFARIEPPDENALEEARSFFSARGFKTVIT